MWFLLPHLHPMVNPSNLIPQILNWTLLDFTFAKGEKKVAIRMIWEWNIIRMKRKKWSYLNLIESFKRGKIH